MNTKQLDLSKRYHVIVEGYAYQLSDPLEATFHCKEEANEYCQEKSSIWNLRVIVDTSKPISKYSTYEVIKMYRKLGYEIQE